MNVKYWPSKFICTRECLSGRRPKSPSRESEPKLDLCPF